MPQVAAIAVTTRDDDMDSRDATKPIFFDCKICKGSKRRSRNSAASSVCKNDSCSKELTRRRRAAREEGPAQGSGDDEPTQCYEVEEVIGVSLCQLSAMEPRDRRKGRKFDAYNICCEVRGGFGEDEDDRFMPDTRWLMLTELVQNIDRTELKKLDKFAKKLAKTLETAQAQLEQQARDD